VANPGDVFTNPVTGERCVVRESDEAAGRALVDLYVTPGGAVAGEHVHDHLVERFEVLEGQVGFRIAGRERIAGPGHRSEVAAGVAHDWWNAGDTTAHVLVEVDGPLAAKFEELIVTLFGLAHDGKVNAKGMPDPLQLALIATEFEDVIRFTRPPRAVQKALFAVLAPIARARGRRATYPHHRDVVVTPAAAPAATASRGTRSPQATR
jgi:mannose-6-phosphate isomerase-like protein (cupin superfamily)